MKQLVPGESQFPGLFKNALKLCLASKMRHEIAGEVRGDHISCKFAWTDLILPSPAKTSKGIEGDVMLRRRLRLWLSLRLSRASCTAYY